MTTTLERQELRRFFRERRRALDAGQQRDHALRVARHLLNSPLSWRSRRIGAYWANDGEVSLGPLLGELEYRKRQLALPVVSTGERMAFYRYTSAASMLVNRYGIAEPGPGSAFVNGRSLDLILVPLVAFDEYGVRLGMGAGYYDRFLGALPAGLRPRVVGIAHEVQRSGDPLPFQDWDIPLDSIVTERGWQAFA
ncbi:MAG: 5-formyltetrahydrofolate cyclo-ligase [Pseudomonadales bacterium]|nr:5-formyltetrahydrofolate cyclo-ligase [Pseudomonadales bacterium]NIX07044.1 5-formyltetrahydrofolate cyclo-ligase [Pseudomonadales bacterium]